MTNFLEQSSPAQSNPALANVDISSLPVAPRDPLADFYCPITSGAWTLRIAPLVAAQGYWSGLQLVEGLVGLQRRDKLWMSITPMETESQQIGIDYAKGHVVIFGLGMGWSAAMSALRPEVEKVTVVEMDDEVLAMHDAIGMFANLPDHAGQKVNLVQADALDWKPDSPVDILMPDIWLELITWGRAEEVHDMNRNVKADMVYFWGQELELARHAVKAGRALDDAGLAATAAEWDLPLVGLDSPDYAKRTVAVTREWMKGRWLDDTVVPEEYRGNGPDVEFTLPGSGTML